MKFRAIIREDDATMVAGAGQGGVDTAWRTVEFECAELARIMSAPTGSCHIRQIVGVEIVSPALEQGGQS